MIAGRAGHLTLSVFVHALAAICFFKHPKHLDEKIYLTSKTDFHLHLWDVTYVFVQMIVFAYDRFISFLEYSCFRINKIDINQCILNYRVHSHGWSCRSQRFKCHHTCHRADSGSRYCIIQWWIVKQQQGFLIVLYIVSRQYLGFRILYLSRA